MDGNDISGLQSVGPQTATPGTAEILQCFREACGRIFSDDASWRYVYCPKLFLNPATQPASQQDRTPNSLNIQDLVLRYANAHAENTTDVVTSRAPAINVYSQSARRVSLQTPPIPSSAIRRCTGCGSVRRLGVFHNSINGIKRSNMQQKTTYSNLPAIG